jgi:catechol 2,3-dioxygenase-like lactoylglutathione lyase family enzyme
MINGAHVIVYSKDAEADRAFFRDVLKFPFVDVNSGHLIFKLPPSEAAFHPAEENGRHDLYLMTDDLEAEMAALARNGIDCEAPTQQSWGRVARIELPGGGMLALYQPRHERP